MKNLLKSLAKSVLIPFGLKITVSATDAVIHKKMSKSSMTTLITSNEKMNITKIVNLLEESGILIKRVSETIQNEAIYKKEHVLECFQVH